jgi:hypothetical protein
LGELEDGGVSGVADSALKLNHYLSRKNIYEKRFDESAKAKFTYGIDGAINLTSSKLTVLGGETPRKKEPDFMMKELPPKFFKTKIRPNKLL